MYRLVALSAILVVTGMGVSCGGSSRTTELSLTGVAQVSCGATAICAIQNDGIVVCWGSNGSGELGSAAATDGAHPNVVPLPEKSTFVRTNTAVGAAACALGASGQAYCWGAVGAVDPTLTGSPCRDHPDLTCSPPTAVNQPVAFSTIAEGSYLGAPLVFGGVAGDWYEANAVCTGSMTDNLALVPRLNGAQAVTVTHYIEGGVLFTNTCSPPFPQIALPRPAVAVSGSCVLLDDATVACAGFAGTKLGAWDPSFDYLAWHVVPGLPPVVSVAAEASGVAACAREASGTVWCWGDAALVPAEAGDLTCPAVTGNIQPTPCLPPTQIPELSGGDVSFGSLFACARLPNATVRCWGENNGQLW